MSESIAELSQIRENIMRTLDELRLDAYLYEIEPREGEWELKVECAVEEGWETVRIPVEKELLLRASEDSTAHQLLLDKLSEALSACLIKS